VVALGIFTAHFQRALTDGGTLDLGPIVLGKDLFRAHQPHLPREDIPVAGYIAPEVRAYTESVSIDPLGFADKAIATVQDVLDAFPSDR
jgi:hypothetical protein